MVRAQALKSATLAEESRPILEFRITAPHENAARWRTLVSERDGRQGQRILFA